MAPAWENLDEFFDADDFGVTGTITPRSGARPYTVTGHFDDPYLNAALGGDALDRDDIRPRFLCPMAKVAGVVRGDTFTLDGVTYDVLSAPHGDGTGTAVLELARP